MGKLVRLYTEKPESAPSTLMRIHLNSNKDENQNEKYLLVQVVASLQAEQVVCIELLSPTGFDEGSFLLDEGLEVGMDVLDIITSGNNCVVSVRNFHHIQCVDQRRVLWVNVQMHLINNVMSINQVLAEKVLPLVAAVDLDTDEAVATLGSSVQGGVVEFFIVLVELSDLRQLELFNVGPPSTSQMTW